MSQLDAVIQALPMLSRKWMYAALYHLRFVMTALKRKEQLNKNGSVFGRTNTETVVSLALKGSDD